MSNIITIKRRPSSGSAGAPSSLKSGELAFNELDVALYYGTGDDGGGNATSIIAIGGSGNFATLATTQTISGQKTFSGNVILGSSATATTPSTSDNSTKVATTAYVKAQAVASNTATFLTVGDQSSSLSNSRRISSSSDVTLTDGGAGSTYTIGLSTTGVTAGSYAKVTVDNKGRVTDGLTLDASDIPAAIARLAGPAFTGVPTAPTAALATNTTQIATTAYVRGEINALVGSAGAALDTLQELAAAIGDDANFATTITTSIATKLAKASNLSDLTDASAARTNLGVAIGSDVQAYNAKLASIAGLTIGANTGIIGASSTTFTTFSLTAAALTLLDDTSTSDMRTTLGLGTIATQNANNVTITGGTINGITIDGGTF